MTYEATPWTIRVAGVVGPFVRRLERLGKSIMHRRAVNELAKLDDRALKDIGLMRTDVHAALTVPLHRDPSEVLMVISGDRRSMLQAEWRESLRRSSVSLTVDSTTIVVLDPQPRGSVPQERSTATTDSRKKGGTSMVMAA